MSERSLRYRAFRFTIGGLVYAVVLVVLLVLPFDGPGPELARLGVSRSDFIRMYFAVGAADGLLLALLYGLRRYFLGALTLGTIAAYPAYVGPAILMRESGDLWSETLGIALFLAFVVGGGSGVGWIGKGERGPPSRQLVAVSWIVVAIGQLVGWYLGTHQPSGRVTAAALALVLAPPYVALIATLDRHRRVKWQRADSSTKQVE